MQGYMGQVMFLYFAVDFLLFLGMSRLFSQRTDVEKAALAALYGSIYAACCLQPGMVFLNEIPCRLVGYSATGLLAFGVTPSGIRSTFLYVVLHMTLSQITQSKEEGAYLLLACSVFFLCTFLLQKERGLYIPVELLHNGRKISLTALRDTGNCLRDPVTGKPVLIVDAVTAEGLTGLSSRQLGNPVETMGTIPGLRLIPYKTVGGTGLLLALRLQNVKIGSWQGSSLVAFSPEIFSVEGMYQALTGGSV